MLREPSPSIPHPTVQIPQSGSLISSPFSSLSVNFNGGSNGDYSLRDALAALELHFPSTETDSPAGDDPDSIGSDEFYMFDFKVRRCARARSHDWTECPYSHPGEKARRRDPRRVVYSGHPCGEFRRGSCSKGDSCEFAHGVFESWLHPDRYRTEACKDGLSCTRRVCFFAHTSDELRVLSQAGQCEPDQDASDSIAGSPTVGRSFLKIGNGSFGSSPKSVLVSPGFGSPPESSFLAPVSSPSEVVACMKKLQLGRCGLGPARLSAINQGFYTLPASKMAVGAWGSASGEEEPAMERVESGRDLRARMYAKLGRENSLRGLGRVGSESAGPDVGWISELVK